MWPNESEDPCSKVNIYVANGIHILIINIGVDVTLFTCFTEAGMTMEYFSNTNDAINSLTQSLTNIDVCTDYTPMTPYDGPYTILESSYNGFPVYKGNDTCANEYFLLQIYVFEKQQ